MTAPTDTQAPWRAVVAKAKARLDIADKDLAIAVAKAHAMPGATQVQIAALLGVSQPTVHRMLRQVTSRQRRENPLGEDPYEICQRYALGQITREQLIDTLSRWPYDEDEPAPGPMGEWDDSITGLPDESFEATVGRAFSQGLLSADDYDAIVQRL